MIKFSFSLFFLIISAEVFFFSFSPSASLFVYPVISRFILIYHFVGSILIKFSFSWFYPAVARSNIGRVPMHIFYPAVARSHFDVLQIRGEVVRRTDNITYSTCWFCIHKLCKNCSYKRCVLSIGRVLCSFISKWHQFITDYHFILWNQLIINYYLEVMFISTRLYAGIIAWSRDSSNIGWYWMYIYVLVLK